MSERKNPYPLANTPLQAVGSPTERQQARYKNLPPRDRTPDDQEKYFIGQAENILAIAKGNTDRNAILKIISRNIRAVYGLAESNTKAICANEAKVKIEKTHNSEGNLIIVTTVDKDSIYGAGI